MNTYDRSYYHSLIIGILHERNVLKDKTLYATHVWEEIFHAVFGEPSQGMKDARWDHLFSPDGLGALRIASDFEKRHT